MTDNIIHMVRSGIYIIETDHVNGDGKCIKIGMSKDIPSRLKQYTTIMGSNFMVYYFYLVPEPIEQVFRVEHLLHEHFKTYHIRDDSANELFEHDALNYEMPLISFPESSQCFRPIPINRPLSTALNIFDPINPRLDNSASSESWKYKRSESFYNASISPPAKTFSAFISSLDRGIDKESGFTMQYIVKKLADVIGYDTDRTTIYIKETRRRGSYIIYTQHPFDEKMRELSNTKFRIRTVKNGKETIAKRSIADIIDPLPNVFGYTVIVTHIPQDSARNILTLKPWHIDPVAEDAYSKPESTITIIKSLLISNISAVAADAWFNRFIIWARHVVFGDGDINTSVVFYGLKEDSARSTLKFIFGWLLNDQNVQFTRSRRAACSFVSGDAAKMPNSYGYGPRLVVVVCKTISDFEKYAADSKFVISPKTAVAFAVEEAPRAIDAYKDDSSIKIGGKNIFAIKSPTDSDARIVKRRNVRDMDWELIGTEVRHFARYILMYYDDIVLKRKTKLASKSESEKSEDVIIMAIHAIAVPLVTVAFTSILGESETKK